MSNINPFLEVEASKVFNYPLIVPTEKWIRIYINDVLIAESFSPLLLLDNNGRQIVYFFNKFIVKTEYFIDSEYTGKNNMFRYWHIKINEKEITNAAYTYNENAQGEFRKLIGYIGFKWEAISKIMEEEDVLIGHPRNPFHRIDTRPSTRLIQFKIGETIIAESKRSIALFETDLRVRYYIPMSDIKMNLLEESKITSICPYKGIASYWNINLDGQLYQDVAWSYLNPFSDAMLVKGYICFWNIDLFVNNEFKGKY